MCLMPAGFRAFTYCLGSCLLDRMVFCERVCMSASALAARSSRSGVRPFAHAEKSAEKRNASGVVVSCNMVTQPNLSTPSGFVRAPQYIPAHSSAHNTRLHLVMLLTG